MSGFVFHPRILRSPWADFLGDELATALASHPDEYLSQIASMGYSGLWIHLFLRETVKTRLFPADDEARKLKLLNKLSSKLMKHGLKLYIYFLEPWEVKASDEVFKRFPHIRGLSYSRKAAAQSLFDGEFHTLCTSCPEVKEYLRDGLSSLFTKVPGLGGIITISGNEVPSHCYSYLVNKHSDPTYFKSENIEWMNCARCAERTSWDVAAEVVTLMRDGVKGASPDADVIIWTWRWEIIEKFPQRQLIARLPKDVLLMPTWEMGGGKKVGGKPSLVDEYSFSFVGPSKLYRRYEREARRNQLDIAAKLQIGNTHELASVPYIPVPFLLAEKLKRMNEMGIKGYVGCWVFGGDVSPLSRLAGKMSRSPQPEVGDAVRETAVDEFGAACAPAVVDAWRRFSAAWRLYPFSVPFLHYSPINYACAYPLSTTVRNVPVTGGFRPLPRDADGHLVWGDNTAFWLKPFPPAVFISCFDGMAEKWEKGVSSLDRGLKLDGSNTRLSLELNLARHILLTLKSMSNIIRFYELRRDGKFDHRDALKDMFEKEIRNAEEDVPLLARDPRIGYHAEAHERLYTVADLEYKIVFMRCEALKLGEVGE